MPVRGWAQSAEPGESEDVAAEGEGDDGDKTAASEAFQQGREAYIAKRYDEALSALRRSHELHPSPNSRLMIAKCFLGMSKFVEAYEELRRTQQEAEANGDPKYRQTAASAREEMKDLRARLAMVRLTIAGGAEGLPAEASVRVDGVTIERERWASELVLAPGAVTISLVTDAGEDEHALSLAAGSDTEVVLTAPHATPADPEPSLPAAERGWFADNQRTMAYVVGGVGAAGMIVFGVFGGLTLSRFDDLEQRCPGGQCPVGTQSDIDSAKTYQTVANVGAIVGAVGLTAGVLLWVLHPDILEGETAPASARLRFGCGGVTVEGSF
jgi:hypothetical protein